MLERATAGLAVQNRPFADAHRLWSLWEMINFFFGSTNAILAQLNVIIRLSNDNMKVAETAGGQNNPLVLITADAKSGADTCVAAAEQNFTELKCPHIDSAIERIKRFLKRPMRWSDLNSLARTLRDSIEVELRQHIFYRYPKHKAEKYAAWKVEWKAVFAAFPFVEMEVFEATDCYGMEHNTASVFHSMRIAEHGLRALAKERRIKLAKAKPLEWGTWQEIIKALDDEIRVIAGKKPGTAKDSALEFYSGARADLNGFKDEYRNLVMHVRAAYDEHQALRALTKVNGFMDRLAAKIDHKHHRIRWGFH